MNNRIIGSTATLNSVVLSEVTLTTCNRLASSHEPICSSKQKFSSVSLKFVPKSIVALAFWSITCLMPLYSSPGFTSDFFTPDYSHMTEKEEVVNDQYLPWPTLIDIDSDGDLDLVVSSWDFFEDEYDPAIVMLNDGNGAFSFSDELMHPMATGGSQHWPLVADFNQDERDDLYVFGMGNEGGEDSDTWWAGTYHQLFQQEEGLGLVDVSSESLADPRRNIAHTAAIGDIDGDGDIDIFNGGSSFHVPSLQNYGGQGLGSHFLTNQGGAGVFTPDLSKLPDFFSAGLPDLIHAVQGNALVDIDRDGDQDLLISMAGGIETYPELFPTGQILDPAFHILLNDGTGEFTVAEAGLVPAHSPSAEEDHFPYNLSIADVNNDGWPDVFVSVPKHTLDAGSLQLLLNNGDGSFSDATDNITLNSPWFPWSPDNEERSGYVLKMFTEDLNDDGWPDLLTLGSDIRIKLLFNNGDGSFQEATSILGKFPDHGTYYIDVGDIDGDGDIDIVSPLMCGLEFCPGLAIMRNSEPYKPATPPPLPIKPDLVTPANSAVDPGTTFAWQHVAGAQTYTIQISKSPSFLKFDSTDLELEGLTGNSIDVSRLVDLAGFDGLETDNRYYWRVAPKNYAGQGAWSETRNFVLGQFVEFNIDAGHSGAWYNPATSGQGGFIDIDPAKRFMFLSWFTFTPGDSDQPDEVHWFTAQGNYTGNTAVLEVYETTGGKFNDTQSVNTELVGSAIIEFNNCETGAMTYDLTAWDKQGEFPIQRAIPGTENVCEQLDASSTQAVDINAGMDGSWYNPETAGQGFFLDAHAPSEGDGFLFLSWFTYGDDTDSGLRWMTAQGGYSGPTAEVEGYETTGGRFDDAQAVDTVKIGTATVTFSDCSNALVAYDLPDEGKQGEIEVTRALPGSSGLCEEATSAR
jgi:hypothetical protein